MKRVPRIAALLAWLILVPMVANRMCRASFVRHTISKIALVFWGALSTCAGVAQTPSDARQFLETVYAQYTPSGTPTAMYDAKAASVLSPSLFRLVQENAKVLQGDVGILDADPVCVCQDYDTIHVARIDVQSDGERRANASVTFSNLQSRQTVRFKLVAVGHAWRIDDIGSADVPSLRAALIEENRKYGNLLPPKSDQ